MGRPAVDRFALVDHLAFVHQDVLSLGTSSSHTLPSGSVICRRIFALGLLGLDTVPVISASVPALSFQGLRASNSSATRGRPPVMSRVFWPSIGMGEEHSPGARSFAVAHLDHERRPEAEAPMVGAGIFTTAAGVAAFGRTPLAAPRRRVDDHQVDRPVTSSTCLATVTPSSTFSNAPAGELGDDRTSHRDPSSASTGRDDGLVGLVDEHRAVRHLVAFAPRGRASEMTIRMERTITAARPCGLVERSALKPIDAFGLRRRR